MLSFWLSQTLAVKRAKVPDALPMRLFISLSNDAFDATLEPRYTKLELLINSNFNSLISY